MAPTEGFKKNDKGKPDYTLIPQAALNEVAKVFTYGASKYGVFNYSKGTTYRRYVAAAHRHINAWLRGENIDESGTNHLSNAIASLMMALDAQMTFQGQDDRNDIYRRVRTIIEVPEPPYTSDVTLDKEMD